MAAHPDDPAPDVSESLFEHVSDGESFQFLPFVPPIELPAGLTTHRLMLIFTTLIVGIVFIVTFRKPKIRPSKFTLAIETIVLFVRDDIVYSTMGETRGRKWLPFFTTLFSLILTANFIGLIPAFRTATGNISVTSALALMILVLIFLVGFARLGPFGFFTNMVPGGTPLGIGLFVALLEFVSTFLKSAILSLRLFANMFAGHLAILSFIVLMFVLNPAMGVISIPFAIFTYALEVLVAFIQAYVFTLLGCIFITMASSSHEH